MPTVITQGAASAKGYGFGASSAAVNYIEDVFSTYLYTGNSSTQTITNGIDLSGKGGLIWTKSRSDLRDNNILDTARGTSTFLVTNKTEAQNTPSGLNSFNTNGYTLNGSTANNNQSGWTYASWTFRKQAKFFDVVTYTGTGFTEPNISHSLGSVPGCIIIKRTDSTGNWFVYHRTIGTSGMLVLNSTAASAANNMLGATPTATTFKPAGDADILNATYVAYLFAHDAGGFGATGSDNVISCGSYTTNGSGVASVTLGYEPQWILWKRSDSTADWYIFDTMRGWTGDPANFSAGLRPNLSNAENSLSGYAVNSTGFNVTAGAASATYIYIAIRRGPMKTPTTGTSVFSPVARAGTSSASSVTGLNFSPDSILIKNRLGNVDSVDWSFNFFDRLRFPGYRLSTAFTDAEDTALTFITSINMDGITFNSPGYTATNGSGYNYINYFFRRAPGFFDEVCYTATGVARTINHNLGVAPELMIVKNRSAGRPWAVYSSSLLNTEFLNLSTTAAKSSVSGSTYWNSTNPTASVFSVGTNAAVNDSISSNYVAYLFATVAGVSKVFSYIGNGTSQTINCGFTGGSRFVLIKRTDSTGNWTVFDSARGIVAGNDPYLLLNSTAAEVTTLDVVDTDSSGFIVNQEVNTNLNVNNATYIGLAIA